MTNEQRYEIATLATEVAEKRRRYEMLRARNKPTYPATAVEAYVEFEDYVEFEIAVAELMEAQRNLTIAQGRVSLGIGGK